MYYVPTRVFFAENALSRAKAKILKLGTRALIVTGAHSALKSGALDAVQSLLQEGGIAWEVFDQVSENPSLETVMDGATMLLETGCDFLIGIGGGSPIDAAKAINLVAANHTKIEDIYNASLYSKAFPLVAIPTTSGTGTEVTPYSVLTDLKAGKKAGFGSELAFPHTAILEPAFTLSLSRKVTLHTGIDALSHLLEGLYSNKRNRVMYPIIYNGIKTIYHNLPKCMSQPDNLEARSEMMRASLYGGMVIAHASTTLQHSIGYPLTTEYGVPHGLANGIVMRSVMDLYYPALKAELDNLFEYLGISRDQFYKWLEALQISLDFQISESFIDSRLPEVLSSRNMANNPFDISAEDIRKIYYELKDEQ
ncbi:MAG: iron-containing alcohol dehydrogenase family protein [Candidatus Cloacimonadota bacterium]